MEDIRGAVNESFLVESRKVKKLAAMVCLVIGFMSEHEQRRLIKKLHSTNRSTQIEKFKA